MLVCICNGISDKDIDTALQEGATSYEALQDSLGLGGSCGQCATFAKKMVGDKIAAMQSSAAFQLATEIRV